MNTAKGQAGARKIEYQFCGDAECSQGAATSDRIVAGTTTIATTTSISAVQYSDDTSSKTITPILAITPKAHSSSKWIFVIALAIIVLVAIEVIMAKGLTRKKRYYIK